MRLLLSIIIFALLPIFSIMALNTLFNLEIPLTLFTWLSALWLHILFVKVPKEPAVYNIRVPSKKDLQ